MCHGILTFSERHPSITLYISFTVDARELDTVNVHQINIVRIIIANIMDLIFLVALFISCIPSVIQLLYPFCTTHTHTHRTFNINISTLKVWHNSLQYVL